mgnify:CR=1 FL=1
MKHFTLSILSCALGSATSAEVIFSNDFESWTGNVPDGWVGSKTNLEADSIAQVSVNPQSGSFAVRLTNMESTHRRFTTGQVTVEDGVSYQISFWVRGTGEIRTGLFDGRTSGFGYATYNSYAVAGATWSQVTQSIAAANDTTGAEFILSLRNSSGPDHVVVDNVTISEAGAPTPVNIYDIQFTTDPGGDSPMANSTVTTGGVVIAAYGSGYWLQDGTGPWNGIFVFDGTNAPAEGDLVELSGLVQENFNMTQLSGVTGFSVVSSGNALPAPEVLSTLNAGQEQWEGVLARVNDATCTDPAPGFGQWIINDGSGPLFVDDLIYAYIPLLGTMYNVTGPVHYTFSEWKLIPRDADDVEVANAIGDLTAGAITIMHDPANGMIVVERADLSPLEFILADLHGRILMSGINAHSRSELNVHALATGVYVLTLRNSQTSRSYKVAKGRW